MEQLFGNKLLEVTQILSAAGNFMTSSERPSPEPFLKKEASQAVLRGRENSGVALEASNALNYRAWGIPAVLLRGIPGNALRAFQGSFRNLSRISSRKSQPYSGCGPQMPFRSPGSLSSQRRKGSKAHANNVDSLRGTATVPTVRL